MLGGGIDSHSHPPTGVNAGWREERSPNSRGRFLHPNIDTTSATPPAAPPDSSEPILSPTTAPLLLNTGSAAKWRRREGSRSNIELEKQKRQRAASELVLKVAVMEEVHGVDVSWLHRPNKDSNHRKNAHSSPDARKDMKAPNATTNNADQPQKKAPPAPLTGLSKLPSPPNVTPPTPVEPTRDTTHATPSAPSASPGAKAGHQKRPSLLSRMSNERQSSDGKSNSKRSSWMNSISSKLSSQGTPERPGPTPQQYQQQTQLSPPETNGGRISPQPIEEAEAYTPSKPKEQSSSFFSNLTRRISSASQAGGIPKVQGTSICPRQVLNVDPNRERCPLPDMDTNKLRKVSFCVDVEIAGGPRYVDDDDEEDKQRKKKEFKKKERAEGEALKNPELLKEEKDEEGDTKSDIKSKSSATTAESADNGDDDNGVTSPGATEEERDAAARKREKKQKSEAERKERKEKRRRRAEESGQVPVEMMMQGADDDHAGSVPSAPFASNDATNNTLAPKTPLQPQPNAHSRQDRPTTDPARIYRRCCQLRESPILKRITEQLSKPDCIIPQEPGVVNCLNLTGSRLQLADVVTLGDWLAVVPVKQIKLEDADLNDEGVRCILAGLLAAKRPEPTKRKSTTPRHRQGIPVDHHQERSGIVEKITLKNNPRISRVGWKHISLFIYMCRSLRTIDVSMNQFPDTLPPSANVTPMKPPKDVPQGKRNDLDAAEALFQCLSQRLGGTRLEELIMSECGLNSEQVRRVVDGAIVCSINRLGLAGNHIDDQGLEHVLHYLRSGICQALDIGGNDLRGKLGTIAEALNHQTGLPCWGLSLADCNLDSASLKPLFAELVKLPSFRFIDLSHNHELCSVDNGLITTLRRYIGQMPDLKRIHLADVNMSPKQAIALADALPEGPQLAHLSLLENPQLTALANATTEADQEEACALYASLMVAVRVSSTLICIDIDVPSSDNSEVVKALAKQVVAYSLRNMEQFAIAEAPGYQSSVGDATAALTNPHGGETGVKDVALPDILMHLVGHTEGVSQPTDLSDPAPDEDYIVGGTGVVKALQYVLGEKANDSKRNSGPPTPTGTLTPKDRPASSAGLMEASKPEAKKMSKNLLVSARKIRDRLQPALIKEANEGDEASYRRLMFLDQTLQSMIQRFEEEYPDTRVGASESERLPSSRTSLVSQPNGVISSSANTHATEATNISDEEEGFEYDQEGLAKIRPTSSSRRTSEANIASRSMSMEEGRLHRIGQQLRREVIDSPRQQTEFKGVPWRDQKEAEHDDAEERERLRLFGDQIESISGVELRKMLDQQGWEKVLEKMGANYEDLRLLQEQDPEAWEAFKDAQEKARLNMRENRI